MVKSELAESLSEQTGIHISLASVIVHLLFQSMTDALVEGRRVEIRGFGSLALKHYDSYQGRNPKTGQPVMVHSKALVRWKTGRELKNRVADTL